MFLDVLINNESKSIEFQLKEIEQLSTHEREWWMISNGETDGSLELKFKDEAFVLKEIIQQPEGLEIQEDVLTDFLNEFLKEEHEKQQEGIDNSDEGSDSDEIQPYDPKKISIRNERWSLSHIYELINEYDDIELNPDFQRNFVWDKKSKSRLIESLMLRIPIPAFYLSENKNGKYQVVDGQQRLTTINSFLNNEFPLKGLEYLTDQESRCFDTNGKQKGIDQEFIRIIKLTQLNINIIEAKSPPKVKYDVFRRVNTGGKPLNNQEIRNCLAEEKTRLLINELAHSEEFKIATGGSVRTTRMQAQELVLRFIAFYHERILKVPEWTYKGNMTEFLDSSVELLNENKEHDYQRLKSDFVNAMKNAYYLFGRYTFRKCLLEHIEPNAKRQLINKSLFTTWSVLLSDISNQTIKSKIVHENLAHTLAQQLDEDYGYYYSVSYKTNSKIYLDNAFQKAQNIITEHILS